MSSPRKPSSDKMADILASHGLTITEESPARELDYDRTTPGLIARRLFLPIELKLSLHELEVEDWCELRGFQFVVRSWRKQYDGSFVEQGFRIIVYKWVYDIAVSQIQVPE